MTIEQGLNSDVRYRGLIFHVQTEDWGSDSHLLISRVYCQGAVVHSFKSEYSEFLASVPRWRWHRREEISPVLKRALISQHERILDLLITGQFDDQCNRIFS